MGLFFFWYIQCSINAIMKKNIVPIILIIGVLAFVFYQMQDKEEFSPSDALYDEALQEHKDSVENVSNSEVPTKTLEELERDQFMRKYSLEVINTVNKNYGDILSQGMIKPNFSNKECQIDPVLWGMFDMDGKRTLLQTIQMKYAFEKLQVPTSFTYFNKNSGRKIASYSDWDGFEFY